MGNPGLDDAETYTCVYETVAKALVETEPIVLEVLPQKLPAAGVLALCLLACAFALAGAQRMRKMEYRQNEFNGSEFMDGR
jgi:hypothetical protein